VDKRRRRVSSMMMKMVKKRVKETLRISFQQGLYSRFYTKKTRKKRERGSKRRRIHLKILR
jgi:hypothetical protein